MKTLDLLRSFGALVFVLACACSPGLSPAVSDSTLRIDGSTEKTFEATLDAMKEPMTPQQRSALTDAMLRIGSRTSLEVVRQHPGDLEALNRDLREQLHGKSAAEILAQGAASPTER